MCWIKPQLPRHLGPRQDDPQKDAWKNHWKKRASSSTGPCSHREIMTDRSAPTRTAEASLKYGWHPNSGPAEQNICTSHVQICRHQPFLMICTYMSCRTNTTLVSFADVERDRQLGDHRTRMLQNSHLDSSHQVDLPEWENGPVSSRPQQRQGNPPEQGDQSFSLAITEKNL